MFEIYKGKKVFVTGHTGFKGSWLTQWLIELKSNIAGYSLDINVPENNIHYEELKIYNVENNFNNIENYDRLKKSLENFQPDLIFHLASQSLVLESYKDPISTYKTNVLGTVNLFEACKNLKNLKGIIIVVTDKIYHEEIYPCRENDKLLASDPYSTSKSCVKLISDSYRKYFQDYLNKKIIITTAQAGNIIGGGDFSRHRIIPDYIRAVKYNTEFELRNPYSTRPYQFVLDCLFGYLLIGEKILDTDCSVDTSFNFGPYIYDEIDNEELIKLAQKYYPYKNIKINSNLNDVLERKYLSLDWTKARKILNWKPKYTIEKAVQKTMEWYKEYIENNNIITKEQINIYIGKLN